MVDSEDTVTGRLEAGGMSAETAGPAAGELSVMAVENDASLSRQARKDFHCDGDHGLQILHVCLASH